MRRERDKGSMSGIEIVGFLASASQLVLYSIKITTCLSELSQRVQDAPLRIRQHSDQIRQLVNTAQLLEQHHLLQTAYVHAQINATLEQAKTLSMILEKLTEDYSRGTIRRYWKILKGAREKEILANFDRLEREKSALLLCISVVQTDLLGNTQGIHNVNMAEKGKSWSNDGPEEEESEANQTPTGNVEANEERTIPKVPYRQDSRVLNAMDHQTQRGQVSSEEMAREGHPKSSQTHSAPDQSHESPIRETHHIYDNVSAATWARLLNGDALSKENITPSPKHLYKNIRGESRSSVMNGNVGDLEFFKAFFSPQPLDTCEIMGDLFARGWPSGKAS